MTRLLRLLALVVSFALGWAARESLGILQAIMHNSNEQPSVRDAAGTAYRLLGGG